MRGHVVSVAPEWLDVVSSSPLHSELVLWASAGPKAPGPIEPGDALFFRLVTDVVRVVGRGWSSHRSVIPASLAWRIYGRLTGSPSLEELRKSGRDGSGRPDPDLDCTLLTGCVVFSRENWIELDDGPDAFDLHSDRGTRLLEACEKGYRGEATLPGGTGPYGPRSFQVAVLDAWGRRCAVTGEGLVTALRAARIGDGQSIPRSLSEALLLRADLAHLFEAGYVTVSSEARLEVSSALPGGEAAREYERLHGTGLRLPARLEARPDPALLRWHRCERYLR